MTGVAEDANVTLVKAMTLYYVGHVFPRPPQRGRCVYCSTAVTEPDVLRVVLSGGPRKITIEARPECIQLAAKGTA